MCTTCDGCYCTELRREAEEDAYFHRVERDHAEHLDEPDPACPTCKYDRGRSKEFTECPSMLPVDDHSANIAAVVQVSVSLYKVVQRVRAGHHLIQLEGTRPVQVQQTLDIPVSVGGAKK